MWALGFPALLLFAVLLSACAPTDQNGSARQRVAAWVRSSQLGERAGTLVADDAHVSAALQQHGDSGVLHTVCLVLYQDAQAAYGSLPTPDDQLTGLLAQAYGAEATAAHQCYDAGTTNRSLQLRSARGRIRARALLDQALTRVAAITGVTVSTTTTSQPGAGSGFS